MEAEDLAHDIWAYGSNDTVWDACFEPSAAWGFLDVGAAAPDWLEVVATLLERIENTPTYAVGDLDHDQAVAAIRRRHPLLR